MYYLAPQMKETSKSGWDGPQKVRLGTLKIGYCLNK